MTRQDAPSGPAALLQLLLSLFTVGALSGLVLIWASAATGPLTTAATGPPTPAPTAPPIAAELPPFFTPSVRFWAPAIQRWAAQHRLDPRLVATVMQIESCGDPRALSRAGAQGLFQVMPYHFAPGEDPWDPDTNARRGLGFLRQMLDRANGDVRLALAAYNGGPLRLQQPEAYWPAETQRYAAWGWGIYRDAQSGRDDSPTLQDWMAAGGQRLCRQAEARLRSWPTP